MKTSLIAIRRAFIFGYFPLFLTNCGGGAQLQPAVISEFAVVANQDNTISIYSIDSSSGKLQSTGTVVSGGSTPVSIAADRTGRFVYIANFTAGGVSELSINASSGTLTPVGSPVPSGRNPRSVTATGTFTYVANLGSNNIYTYAIDSSTGALTQVSSPLSIVSSPLSLAVDSAGRFAYAVSTDSNTVSVFTINGTTGGLTAVGSPVSAGTSPEFVLVHASGKFAYVVNTGSQDISVFAIDPHNGSLTSVGSPVADQGSFPVAIAGDPSGQFVYLAGNTGSSPVGDAKKMKGLPQNHRFSLWSNLVQLRRERTRFNR